MPSKYCQECGSPFLISANNSSAINCSDCLGLGPVTVQSTYVSKEQLVSSVPTQESQTKEKVDINPNNRESSFQSKRINKEDFLLEEEPSPQDLKSSFMKDFQRTRNAVSSYKTYQSHKAEDVLASNPNQNHHRGSRKGVNQSAEDLLKGVGERKNIDF